MRPHHSVRGLLCPSRQLMHARGQFVGALWELFSASRRLGDLLHGPSLCEPGLAPTTERPHSHRVGWSRNAMRLRHFKDIRLNQRLRSRVSAVVRSNGKTPRREDAEFRGGKPGFHLTRESRQARAANADRTFLYAACFVRLVNSCTPAGSLFVRFGSFSRRLGVSAICFMGHRIANPAARTPPSGPIRIALRAHPSACACMAFPPCLLGKLGVLGGTCRCRAGSMVWARSRPVHRARLPENRFAFVRLAPVGRHAGLY
jgi:hypothetical protein